MPTYTITKVHDSVRDWSGQGDHPMKSYRIDLADANGQPVRERVELAQRATTAVPTVGQKIDGQINERKYTSAGEEKTDWKFQKAGGGGGGGGGRPWKPRPDDCPEVYASRQAMIARQHSQNIGMRILELAHASGDDLATVMDRLGIAYATDKGDLSVVDAVAKDVATTGFRAWTHETGSDTQDKIADALARRES